MTTTNPVIFLQLIDEVGQNTLYPGNVVGDHDKIITVCFGELGCNLDIKIDQELLILFEHRHKFMRQSVRVNSILTDEAKLQIVLHKMGQPLLSEKRQSYRVSTVAMDLTVKVGCETGCPLKNVSATGLAVVAMTRYQIGQTVEVEIQHDGKVIRGRTHVVLASDLRNGHIRYGLLCIDDNKTNGELVKGLAQFSVALQRLQLRRLAKIG